MSTYSLSPYFVNGGITLMGIALIGGAVFLIWWVCSFGYAVFHTSGTYSGGTLFVKAIFVLLIAAPFIWIWLARGGANGIAIHPISP
jgi:hypothetical protein